MSLRKLGSLAGLIGPLLFVGVFTIEGWLRPGYHATSMLISELSLGPRGPIQIASFVIFGLLLMMFSRSVAAEFKTGKAALGAPLLGFIGFCFLLSGVFVMDPAATPLNQLSTHGILHYLFGAMVFGFGPVACFMFFRRFRSEASWRPLAWWTFAVGVIMVAVAVLMKVGPAPPGQPPRAFNHIIGVVQRASIVSFMAWIFSFAWVLRSRCGQSEGSSAS